MCVGVSEREKRGGDEKPYNKPREKERYCDGFEMLYIEANQRKKDGGGMVKVKNGRD